MRMNSTEGPTVLYEDAALIALDKPPGLPVQPDRTGDHSLLDQVRSKWGSDHVGLVHRLDRPVSGVVLFARDQATLVKANELFASRMVKKTYWAIVEGEVPEEGTCKHVLERLGRSRRAVARSGPEDLLRELRFRRMAQGDRFALLEVRPEGGAFHQIRAQLAAAGMPIKGDVKYGARRGEPDRSISLHAHRLELPHPRSGAPLVITAAEPVRSIWPALLKLRS